MNLKSFYVFITTSLLFIYSCNKEEFLTTSDISLKFSKDTISFDTVFTTFGSATKQLMVYNPYDKSIRISNIRIAGGENSFFKFNADGFKGPEVKDIEIGPNDSAYIFVQVLVDPRNSNNPLVVEDSLLFTVNGNPQQVNLEAWGQDVHLIKDSLLKTQTWTNDKPYLILDATLVDTLETLTIEAGTTIYLHRDAMFFVDGTLISNGTKNKPVVFRGDRLDKANYVVPIPYDKLPGQWMWMVFRNPSKNSKLVNTEIRNSQYGIVVGEVNKEGKTSLELTNCKISNNSYFALFGTNSTINAQNCVFSNSGLANFFAAKGGEYEFTQCTFATYDSYIEKSYTGIVLQNFAINSEKNKEGIYENVKYYGDLKKASFKNCIIYSDATTNINLEAVKDYQFEYTFDHCLIRDTIANPDINLADKTRFIKTTISGKRDPGFKTIDVENKIFDFRIIRKSSARNAGDISIGQLVPFDILGNSRTADDAPDLGAYEYQNGD